MSHPWWNFKLWQPFSIDALGLVTLLGAEEVNATVGRLVPSRWFDYYPMLGAFVIAGDRFKDKRPSFNMYNISAGIQTPDLSCWMTRWMIAQEFDKNRSVVQFEVEEQPVADRWTRYAFGFPPFLIMCFLIAMSILSDDWYGFANAISMSIAILVRTYILGANRSAIDSEVDKWQRKAKFTDENGKPTEKQPSWAKCMIIMSDSKAVTVFVPSHLLVSVLVNNPEPSHPWFYHAVRWVGWIAFVVHVLCIGRASLPSQIFAVVILVIPTILVHWKTGCDDSKWGVKWEKVLGRERAAPYSCWFGTKMKATVFEWPPDTAFTRNPAQARNVDLPFSSPPRNLTQSSTSEFMSEPSGTWYRYGRGQVLPTEVRETRRMDLYARLNLTDDEEQSMTKWDLFPHQRPDNTKWWEEYLIKKELIQRNPPSLKDMRRRTFISRNGTMYELQAEPVVMPDPEKGVPHVSTDPPIGVKRVLTSRHLTAGGFLQQN